MANNVIEEIEKKKENSKIFVKIVENSENLTIDKVWYEEEIEKEKEDD